MEKKIIVWDFSLIQKYLYDIKKNKSATKRLKWRSVFIEILLEKVKNDLKEKLWNCEDYLISWWKFILICNEFDGTKFSEFKNKIEEKLYKQFYGELKIIFWTSNYDEIDFKTSLNEAFEDLAKNKNRSFENIFIENWVWNSEKFVFEEKNDKWENIRWTENICTFSRWDLIDRNIQDWYINKIIQEEEVKWMWLNTKNDIIISNFIAWNEWWNKKITIFWNEERLNSEYKKYLPRFEKEEEVAIFNKNKNESEKVKKWDIKSFEGLAWEWKFNKLACFKWDIDDLWKLFMFDLKLENYKENYKKLSEKLDNFWDKTLYTIISNKNIYTVYAGWDDFLILWKWNEIIEFYIELKNKFKIFTNSEEIQVLIKEKKEIHFSGAINLFWPHDTFFIVVKQSEILLSKAKENGKNNINIFWKVIRNDDFEKLFEEIIMFEKKYDIYNKDNKIISTQTLRFLLDIAKKKILEENKWISENWTEKEYFEYGLWKAELFYMLWKNYKTRNLNDDIDLFRRYIDWMILKNDEKSFASLSWNNDLFDNHSWEKLFVMMSYLLYKLRG